MEIEIKEIFERADIKQIREFILGKGIIADNYYGTYQERLDRDSEDIFYALKRLSKDDAQFNESAQELTQTFFAYRDVFTEIGMKIGARLLYQLLLKDE